MHYVTTTERRPDLTDVSGIIGVPDYVEKIDTAAETSFAVENTQLGWPAPRSDGSSAAAAASPTSTWSTSGAMASSGTRLRTRARAAQAKCFAFLVMDNDFSFTEFGYQDPQIPLEVTIAHEYNHVLQFGIDAALDSWLFESTRRGRRTRSSPTTTTTSTT